MFYQTKERRKTDEGFRIDFLNVAELVGYLIASETICDETRQEVHYRGNDYTCLENNPVWNDTIRNNFNDLENSQELYLIEENECNTYLVWR